MTGCSQTGRDERKIARALAVLARPGAILAPLKDGYGLYREGDRRRRACLHLNAAQTRALEAEGAIAQTEAGVFTLAAAGAKRVAREAARPDEAFLAQHAPVALRSLVTPEGGMLETRGVQGGEGVRRLEKLKDAAGGPWLAARELDAARKLRRDWEAGQAGLVRGSDWSAPPRGAGARGPGNPAEAATIAGMEARRRVEIALGLLAPPLRRVVERVCFHEDGLDAIESAEGWPARSAKLALKLALAQLAAQAP